MMKFMMMILCMSLMLVKNKMLLFYYNLCYLMSFMMLFMYYYKSELWFNISLAGQLSVSYYSFLLIMLSVWVIGLMFMSLGELKMLSGIIFISLMFLLLLFFLLVDMMLFYLVFEISLIPTFFLIIYFGMNPERLNASYYMIMYMLLISFPLLVYIYYLNSSNMTLKFVIMIDMLSMYEFSFWGYLVIYVSFYIKVPLYLFHIWLPKAHVEAPVYGSMILAGILLKMGSYGLIRLMEIFVKSSMKFNYFMLSISAIGSVVVSILCLTQIDMKSLVAYSSVVHMNMMLCSLLTLTKLGFVSSYLMMISHGLCSSGMFYLVNLFYLRSSSRLMVLNKGLLGFMPSLMLWWFMFCIINFSFPVSLNFISEILMLMVILNWDKLLMLYFMLVCFFSGAYSLYLYSYVSHGVNLYYENKIYNCMVKEYMGLIFHLFPLLMVLLNLIMFM